MRRFPSYEVNAVFKLAFRFLSTLSMNIFRNGTLNYFQALRLIEGTKLF